MEMQKYVTFAKKKKKIEKKYLKDKKYHKVADHCHNIGEYRVAVYM